MTSFLFLASTAAGPLPPQHLPNWGDNPLGTWFVIFFFTTPFIIVVIAGIYLHFQNKRNHANELPETRRQAIKTEYLTLLLNIRMKHEEIALLDQRLEKLEAEYDKLQGDSPFRSVPLKDEVTLERIDVAEKSVEPKKLET